MIDMDNPEVQEIIKAEAAKIRTQIEAEYSGLKKNKDEILEEKKKLTEELKKYDGIDVERVKKLQAAAEKDTRLKLLTSGDVTQIDEYLDDEVNKRTEMMRNTSETRITAVQKQLDEYQRKLLDAENRYKQFSIDTKVREAAISKFVQPEMMDYVTEMGRKTFSHDEDGRLVMRDDGGNLKLGRDGVTPMTPEEWLLTLKDKIPYMFQQSTGAGVTGNSAKGKGGVKYKEDLTSSAAKAKFIGEHGMDSYLELPNRKAV